MQGPFFHETSHAPDHKSKHIADFFYDNSKEDLTWITDRNFSSYRCLNQELLTLDPITLETELVLSDVVFQSPEHAQNYHSSESNTPKKANNCTESTLGII